MLLAGLCGQILDLTFRQRQAIRQDRWTDLLTLLAEREGLLVRAGDVLAADPPDRPDRDLLVQIHEADATNQRILGSKRQDLLDEIHRLQHSRTALAGYQAALRGNDPTVGAFDRAR